VHSGILYGQIQIQTENKFSANKNTNLKGLCFCLR
jgi:hypothetical protein